MDSPSMARRTVSIFLSSFPNKTGICKQAIVRHLFIVYSYYIPIRRLRKNPQYCLCTMKGLMNQQTINCLIYFTYYL